MSAIQSPLTSSPGLEGVVAFATEIAEPDKRAARCATAASTSRTSSARSRSSRSGACSWTARFSPGLPPAEPHPLTVRSGDPRVDVQSALAMLAPEWGFGQLIDISDEEARDDLARASVMALSFVAQSARGAGQPPVPQARGRPGPHRSPSAS